MSASALVKRRMHVCIVFLVFDFLKTVCSVCTARPFGAYPVPEVPAYRTRVLCFWTSVGLPLLLTGACVCIFGSPVYGPAPARPERVQCLLRLSSTGTSTAYALEAWMSRTRAITTSVPHNRRGRRLCFDSKLRQFQGGLTWKSGLTLWATAVCTPSITDAPASSAGGTTVQPRRYAGRSPTWIGSSWETHFGPSGESP